ncbi:MAG: zinc ribbon domain-containing protein [Chloroflexi bacterium]|nr:zinc ribbon domain-containing protein [Chloroflexota bacterium]
MPFCPNCGKGVSSGMVYCPSCGQELPIPIASSVENTSGRRTEAVVPAEIKGWNWGAFLLWWIWGIGNKTYISFLTFIPVVQIIMPFVLGAKGNEWAWRNKRWDSIKHFKEVQKQWALGGLIPLIILLAIWAIAVIVLNQS